MTSTAEYARHWRAVNQVKDAASNRRRHDERYAAYTVRRTGPCVMCGQPAEILHHRDHETKLFNPSDVKHRAWMVLEAEWDKCDRLCRACHHDTHRKYPPFEAEGTAQ